MINLFIPYKCVYGATRYILPSPITIHFDYLSLSLPNINARIVSATFFVRPDMWDPHVRGCVPVYRTTLRSRE
jgi:hypothetical protein